VGKRIRRVHGGNGPNKKKKKDLFGKRGGCRGWQTGKGTEKNRGKEEGRIREGEIKKGVNPKGVVVEGNANEETDTKLSQAPKKILGGGGPGTGRERPKARKKKSKRIRWEKNLEKRRTKTHGLTGTCCGGVKPVTTFETFTEWKKRIRSRVRHKKNATNNIHKRQKSKKSRGGWQKWRGEERGGKKLGVRKNTRGSSRKP